MKTLIFLAAILLFGLTAMAQAPSPTSKSLPDQPISSKSAKDVEAIEEAIKPYVEEAKKTYPDAKARFKAGLPAKHSFYVVTRLSDPKGHFEQIFVGVEKIEDGYIAGKIRSRIVSVEGYKYGDSYRFPEKDLIDWVITRPDGSEEGNVVGKFLDSYRKSMK